MPYSVRSECGRNKEGFFHVRNLIPETLAIEATGATGDYPSVRAMVCHK